MTIFPTKNQLLKTFSTYSNWEEKYMYIIDLGYLLPEFPKKFRIKKYQVSECQSYTWIALIKNSKDINDNHTQNIVKFYGDSDAAIIKGIIVIIFSLYQNLNIKLITKFDIYSFFDKLQLTQHLTISRSQGIYSILKSIRNQAYQLMSDN